MDYFSFTKKVPHWVRELLMGPNTNFKDNQVFTWGVVLIFYYVPPLLLLFDIIPFDTRFLILVSATILMILYAITQNYSWYELGFRTDTLIPSLLWNGALIFVFAIILVTAYFNGAIRQPTIPASTGAEIAIFFIFYLLISGPLQEYMYRSLLFAMLKRLHLQNGLALIILTSITYCYLHIFYKDTITLITTFGMGLLWGTIYYYYPNIWGCAISHSVLGAVSIAVGLI
ncbi:CPBP family intramembrane metalloprotease [bacterium]|nr:CPBP family intramembrane metalloprotease [bacterium]